MAKRAARKKPTKRRPSSTAKRLIDSATSTLRSGGRRQSDVWPVVTKILGNLLVITGAIVSVIYSYGFGQQSNDPLIATRERVQQIDIERQERETEALRAEIRVLKGQK